MTAQGLSVVRKRTVESRCWRNTWRARERQPHRRLTTRDRRANRSQVLGATTSSGLVTHLAVQSQKTRADSFAAAARNPLVRQQSFSTVSVNSFLEKGNIMLRKLLRNKKGQGLVEYGLIIAGVALICAAAVSMFGHKTSDLISAVATILPGAHASGNAPMASGKLIETTAAVDAETPITLDAAAISTNSASPRLGVNVGLGAASDDFGGLILDPPAGP